MGITLYTGTRGMDLFNEMMDREFGYERIYISKVSRIMKKVATFKRNLSGRYYRRIKIAP
jgi:hypothetical protein